MAYIISFGKHKATNDTKFTKSEMGKLLIYKHTPTPS